MLHIFICEDEEIQLNYIKDMISEYVTCRKIDAQIAAAERAPESILKKLHEESPPALFFIDVQLDGCEMDGFELACRLKSLNREHGIVFLTSNAPLAYKAFEYRLEVLDYIVKEPEYFLRETISDRLSERLDVVFEKVDSRWDRKNKKTILLFCGSKVTEVILHDHMITVREPLKSLYRQLGKDFIYVNKSCIVNRYKMKELDKKERFMHLSGGFRVEVSYRELKGVERVLKNNCAG